MSSAVDGTCPDDDDVLAFVSGTLDAAAREAVASHMEACDACRDLLACTAVAPGQGADAQGRYELLSAIGAGGMGIVQAAFDRELSRKVALKFIVAAPGDDEARARSRLAREAKALAQLTHPNVITVHDVGVLDGEVFIAMELVDGQNLREWLAAEPRTLSAKLRVLRDAGEGLAAAHAAGIVHRDFKPENVLVGRDGRTRVTDFGLALEVEAQRDPDGPESRQEHPPPLTRTGVRAGTPAYMAPEQKLGRVADVRSDVYSYCVTAFEAVTGVRPGSGKAPSRRLPRWLARALERGLRERADARWSSMRPLLDVLGRGPVVTPGRVAGALGLAALAAVGIARARHTSAPPLCVVDESAFAGVWDDARRDAVRASFRGAHPANGDAAFAVVDDALVRMRSRWVAMRAESCAATRIRKDQSEAILDLRSGCLDVERDKARALVQVLAQADRSVVDNAGIAVANLPAVDDCANVRVLTAMDPPPADARQRAIVDDAQGALARATALHYTGKESEALAIVEPALTAVRSTGYGPLEAKLLVLRADVLMELARPYPEVVAAMHEAARRAIDVRDDASAAAAWILLTWQEHNLPDGRLWAGYAEAAITRMGGDDFLEADRSTRLGQIELFDGHLDTARALFERAKPLFEKTRGPGYYRIGSILDGMGEIAAGEQNTEEAMRYHHLGRELRERAVGRDNVATVSSLFNEENDLVKLGRLDAAAAALADLDAIYARTGAPEVGYLEMAHATLDRARGDFAAALTLDQAAKENYAQYVTPDDTAQQDPLVGLGMDFLGLGRPADAIAPLEKALRLTDGSDRLDRSDTLFALARALDGAKRDRARAVRLASEAADRLAKVATRYGGEYATKREEMLAWVRARS